MNPFLTLWRRFRSLWQSRAVKQEIDDELQFHLAMREQENLRAGLAPKEAARDAKRRFGNFQSVREECRELRGVSFGRSVWQDVHFGLRMLRKNPGFTTVAVLTLALGIGVNTSMFSTLKALLFAEEPFPHPEQLVRLSSEDMGDDGGDQVQSAGDFLDEHDQSTVFSSLGALHFGPKVSFSSPGAPAEAVRAICITEELLPALGVRPLAGRIFTEPETRPGAEEVVLLNREFWLRRFNGDPQIVGRTLRLDGKDSTVVGVVALDQQTLLFGGPVDILRPQIFEPWRRKDHNAGFLTVIGRLKPGVSLAQAQGQMNGLAQRLSHDYPKVHSHLRLHAEQLSRALLNRTSRRVFWALFTLTGLVLLIACANLANLQLARLASRARELGIRAALGAGRGRLVRQLLTESVVLALLGGALGLLFAFLGNELLGRQFTAEDDGSPLLLAIPVDRTVLSFTLLVSACSGLLVGTAPVWFLLRGDLNPGLLESRRSATAGRSRHRLQNALIVAEIAMALPLLACAGVVALELGQSVFSAPGWQPEGLMSGEITLSGPAYDSDSKREPFLQQVKERVAAVPGVQSVSVASGLPFEHDGGCWLGMQANEAPVPERHFWARVHQVDAQYFQTVGMTLRQGRAFSAEEAAKGAPVVAINRSLADKLWPGKSPVGQRLPWSWSDRDHWPEVAGVVNDVVATDNWHVYRPRGGNLWATSLIVRAAGEPRALAAALRQTLAGLDPDLSLSRFQPARKLQQGVTANERTLCGLIGGFGLLGMLLATVGIYGVTAHVVSRRTNEFGIRLALGAQRANVLWLVLRSGLRLGLFGTLLGLVGGSALLLFLKAMSADLFDPKTLGEWGLWILIGGAAVVLVGTVLAACWLPARRATQIDPMSALRYE